MWILASKKMHSLFFVSISTYNDGIMILISHFIIDSTSNPVVIYILYKYVCINRERKGIQGYHCKRTYGLWIEKNNDDDDDDREKINVPKKRETSVTMRISCAIVNEQQIKN